MGEPLTALCFMRVLGGTLLGSGSSWAVPEEPVGGCLSSVTLEKCE